MSAGSVTRARVRHAGARQVVTWALGLASFGMLAWLLGQIAYQMAVPPPAQRLLLVKDVPLPSGYVPRTDDSQDPGQTRPLDPGITRPFDKFDFQALDPQTHLLFIAHTGASATKLDQAQIEVDRQADGHIVVFDTRRNAVVGRVDIPHVTGIVAAPDLHKVFAADKDDNIVYAIDEHTLTFTPIAVGQFDNPDALAYDPVDQRIFVSAPGTPEHPVQTLNIDPKDQNVLAIDARTDKVVARINIGGLPILPQEQQTGQTIPVEGSHDAPAFGYAIGHARYDPVSRRVFVTTQMLPDQNSANPVAPRGTGELMAIDPVAGNVVRRVVLPPSCSTPHGMTLDPQQEVAFIACVDLVPGSTPAITPNLVRVDLKAMRPIPADVAQMRLPPGPDIVVLDSAAHILLVGCKDGVSVFDERPGAFRKLRDYILGKNTHTLAVDEATQYIYIPLTDTGGGRPVLRIVRYNPSGV